MHGRLFSESQPPVNGPVNPALTARDGGANPVLHLTTLGELRLEGPAETGLLRGRRKELVLLAYLARRAPRATGREELAALLWEGSDSSRARQSLRHALLQLRRAVGDVVVISEDRVGIDSARIELDAAAFEQELAEGRASEAVVRWRGDFLAGMEDIGGESFRAWIESEREGLRRRLATALERLISEALARGHSADAIAWAERWVEHAPLDEQAQRRLIDALKSAGQPDEALARHAAFAARLRAELEREPSPAFSGLTAGLERAARQSPPAGPGSAALLTPDMVGREAVLAELIAAWHETRGGGSAIVLAAGDEGLGKSRLCQEFTAWVRSHHSDACILMGRAQEAERTAQWSAATHLLAGLAAAPGVLGAAPAALRAIGRIVPAIAPGAVAVDTAPADEVAEMADAVPEVLEAVASEAPVLLVLDDAPFSDPATSRILVALVDRPPPGSMLVMTGRTDALSASPLIEQLRRSRMVRRLQLQPLGPAETEALLGSIVALAPDDQRRLAARLHAETGGNPFYSTELVFALADDGTLALDARGNWHVDRALLERRLPLPSGVRDAIRRRLTTLSAEERLVLGAAARSEGPVEPISLAEATALPEDRLTAALDQLLARRLLREGTGDKRVPAYEFSHEMVRRVARELSPPPRSPDERRLHPGDQRAWRRNWRRIALFSAVALLAVAAVVVARRRTSAAATSDRPVIAIIDISVASPDTAAQWLADGLPQMIAARIGRSGEVDVVAPMQTRAVRMRAGYAADRGPVIAQLLDIARRVRATIAVSGELTRADTAVVLSLNAYDVRTGRLLRSDALVREDVLALADEAAARLLDAAGAQERGPRLAELETSSVEAYRHFVRANRLLFEGHFGESARELDAAVALDSGFVSAVQARLLGAIGVNDYVTAERLVRALERSSERASEFDRLFWATAQASRQGERARSEALARQLVTRYPRDPRSHAMLIDVYAGHGRWDAAEAAIREAMSLDSLGIEAGEGPCIPCLGYGRLVSLRLARGDWTGAEGAARRWIALQPELPAAWRTLAVVLTYVRRHDEALAAMRRSIALSGSDPSQLDQLARMLVLARRLEEADSLVEAWRAGRHAGLRRSALDLRVMLDRERGRLRASNRSIDRALAIDSTLSFLELIRGNTLGRLGEYAAAEGVYERHAHGRDISPVRVFPPNPWDARGFCWDHALLADALAPAGDTVRLLAIADTLERGCARSYYARDWKLHHHVRGLVHAAAGRHDEAARAFQRAEWIVADGWSRTRVELAKAQIALGRAGEALATLRIAYATPLDAMGRYVPRSELDYHMAVAFDAAGMADSAAAYAAHVRRVWRDADPEVKRLMSGPGPFAPGRPPGVRAAADSG